MVARVRIYELAKTLGRENKEIMAILEAEFDVSVKSHSSSIDQPIADKVVAFVKGGGTPPAGSVSLKKKKAKKEEPPKPVTTTATGDGGEQPVLRVSLIKKKDRVKPVAIDEPEPSLKGLSALRAETEQVSKDYHRKVHGDDEPTEAPAAKAEPATEAPKAEPVEEVPTADVEPTPEAVTAESDTDTTPDTDAVDATADDESNDSDTPSRGRIQAAVPEMPGLKIIKPADKKLVEPTILGKAPVKLSTGERQQQSGDGRYKKPISGDKKPGDDNFSRGDSGRGKVNTIPPHLRNRTYKAPDDDNLAKLLNTKKKHKQKKEEEKIEITEVRIDEQLSVRELAEKLGKTDTDIIRHVFMKGMMVTVNQTLEVSFARSIAEEFEITVLETEVKEDTYDATEAMGEKEMDDTVYKNLEPKWPVVSIMGHVDHGKTSLLDAIRASRHEITKTEAGGITQSIGAYTVEKDDRKIVFLDTPGHEAFTAMRMRGAQSTNIAILVVAADDGVMPQTIEAINHAKAANIPMIVAINKVDKPDADPYKVMAELMQHEVNLEEMGGDVLSAKVSAIEKTGLDDLLDQILLVSELLNLKADPTVPAEGVVIEAKLDKRRGPIMTALVQNGTLKVGDNILTGSVGGRVRALIDDHGNHIKTAGPATPVEILGMSDVPNAGDTLNVITDDKEFKRQLAEAKTNEKQATLDRRQIMPGLQAPEDGDNERETFVHFIVKADSQGSTEAVNESITALSTDEVKIKIIHSGTGNITEADIMLAAASNAVVIGFNVGNESGVDDAADRNTVQIRNYDVIYHITEDVEKIMVGEMSPDVQDVEKGRAEVRDLFTISNRVIAGCMVTEGKALKNARVKVERGGETVFTGKPLNLKRFKENVQEVANGFECGLQLEKFDQLQIGDVLVFMVSETTQRTLADLKQAQEAASVK